MSKNLKIHGSDQPICINYEDFKQGSKNAALPVIGASLLFDAELTIGDVPHISDILNIFRLLKKIGVNFSYADNVYAKHKGNVFKEIIFEEDFFETRGGFYVVAALINRCKIIIIKKYGMAGCKIGERGHGNIFRVFKEFGFSANIVKDRLVIKKSKRYFGKTIMVDDLGICASGVALILASQFKTKTTLINTGKAPEINDLTEFLINNGVNISKLNDNKLVISRGKKHCRKSSFNIQDDRIVIATYLILSLITEGSFKIKSSKLQHLLSFVELLKACGVNINNDKKTKTVIFIRGKKMSPAKVVIYDYPSIPTDIQPVLSVFLCTIKGPSVIRDNIFPDRKFHISQLKKMNQDIKYSDSEVFIKGGRVFKSNNLRGHDIRCSAALILASCIASGVSVIKDWQYVNRGYESLLEIIKQNRKLVIA